MDPLGMKRRLTCILAADAVGYSRLMGADEAGTIRILAAHRAVIDGIIAFHEGRIIGTAGDSVLAEFASAVEGVRCAVEIQEALKTRNEALPEDHRLLFRVGVNLGDVVVKGDDLLGDGVNVAARLEGIAEPGGVCISSSVYDQITGKLDLGFVDIGEQSLKNISRPIRVYRVSGTAAPQRAAAAPPAPRRTRSRGPLPWAIAGAAVTAVVALGVAWLAGWLGGAGPAPRGTSPQAVVGPPPTATPPSTQEARTAAGPPSPPADAAAEDRRRRLESEAELARARAEVEALRARADAAATRAKAEAEALRLRAEAEAAVARTRAEADAARQRAQSEAEKILSAAEADRARAEQVRRDLEARAAVPTATARPAATAAATPWDGEWTVSRVCAAFQNLPAGTDTWTFTVRDGEFVLERGVPGEPRYSRIAGRPAVDGRLVLAGTGISGAQGSLGQPLRASFEGRLEGDRGVLQGKYGSRDCTLTLARPGATPVRSEAPAGLKAPAPSTGQPATATPWDGPWTVSRACGADGSSPPWSDAFTITVRDGQFVIERGVPGQPRYSRVAGRPAEDGRLVLTGGGVSAVEGSVGRQFPARFEGRLGTGRSTLQGKYGARDCTLTLARAGG